MQRIVRGNWRKRADVSTIYARVSSNHPVYLSTGYLIIYVIKQKRERYFLQEQVENVKEKFDA